MNCVYKECQELGQRLTIALGCDCGKSTARSARRGSRSRSGLDLSRRRRRIGADDRRSEADGARDEGGGRLHDDEDKKMLCFLNAVSEPSKEPERILQGRISD